MPLRDRGFCRCGGVVAQFQWYKSVQHFDGLDGLRFLSILAVLWHHAPISQVVAETYPIFGRGFLGVDLFFVISGYLITTLLLREQEQAGKIDLIGFYRRRAVRILPPYLLIVAICAALYVRKVGWAEVAQFLPYYLTFTSNFLVEHIPSLDMTWSLAVEEQYYLIWPAMLMFLPRHLVMPALVLLLIVNIAAGFGAFSEWEQLQLGLMVFQFPDATYAPILLGTVLAILLNYQRSFDAMYRLIGAQVMPIVAINAVLMVLLLIGDASIAGVARIGVQILFAALVGSVVMTPQNMLMPILKLPFVVRIGKISYGIYLYHLLILVLSGMTMRAIGFERGTLIYGWLLAVFYSGASIIAAEISFRTLEAYFLRFRKSK